MASSRHRGPLEIAEGFYLSHIVYHLHRRNVLERLGGATTTAELADEYGYDPDLLGALLEFVRQRTDLLNRDISGRYSLNPAYVPYRRFGFHLDKLIGAYGPPLERLEESLRSPTLGRELVDRGMLAQAFCGLEAGGAGPAAQIIRDWNVSSLLDLGCGPGTLLLELASADSGFRGWGVDANAHVCAAAAERVASAGLAEAVRVIHADVRELGTHLDSHARGQIEALHGGSVLNEFFGSGASDAVDFVESLRGLFPGRLLFVSDYYGKLGVRRRVKAAHMHTLLQDVAQMVSEQGVPPPDLAGWAEIYEDAGSTLVHAYEGDHGGISWFIHVVRL